MSYFLEDRNGYLGEFASTVGLMRIRRRRKVPVSLKRFLDNGMATAAQAKAIANECAEVDGLESIAALFAEGKPPIVLSDGVNC